MPDSRTFLPVALQCVQCKTPLANDAAIYEAVFEFINGLNKARTFRSDKLEMDLVIRDAASRS